MREKATIVSKLPDSARDAVVRNMTKDDDAKWVLINLKASPPVVIPSKNVGREEYLNAMVAMKDQVYEDA